MLIYGNGERPLVEVAHRLAAGEKIGDIHDIRNTAVMRKEALPGWSGVDSTRLDKPGRIEAIPNPYGDDLPCADGAAERAGSQACHRARRRRSRGRRPTCCCRPSRK